MASAADPTEFPIVDCAVCDRDVLGYLDLDEQEQQITRCLECATVAAAAAIRWGDLHAIEALGYGFVLPEGGCGRPDCGQDRCGKADQ
ncbi:MAG: hypothetical protein H6Q34_75 [Deltaproteobacteria bacterium]|nr:hypothetical protein [Deltaproteobacteria bacterium]